MANFFAQTEALMKGKSRPQVEKELIEQGLSSDEIKKIIPYKEFKGDKPSTTLLIDKLNPETIGSLIAMYEHKIFVEGVIWNIFSFDQYGVELGKELANNILKNLKTSSTKQGSLNEELLKRYKS
jgi:glucose-6-phosphate isomerase